MSEPVSLSLHAIPAQDYAAAPARTAFRWPVWLQFTVAVIVLVCLSRSHIR